MGGGRAILTLTAAGVGIATKSADVKSSVPNKSFFILLPPETALLYGLDVNEQTPEEHPMKR